MSNNIARIGAQSSTGAGLNQGALALIRRTIAKDTTDQEFDLFISYARSLNLDPRRKQIYAVVYNKDKPDKRRMSIIVGIDGFRTIAARSGNYRPDEDEPTFEIDQTAKSPTNPIGLVKATVRVWRHAHGDWHKITASAFWDEYAPVVDEWRNNSETNRREKTGAQKVDGKWATMPRVMLAKVAEALALRKGWPDDFSGVSAEEEMYRSQVEDMAASEAVALADEEERFARIGGAKTITFEFNDLLERVPIGLIADRILAFVAKNKDEPSTILLWRQKNTEPLREYWATNPSDALEVKKVIEKAIGAVP